MLCRDIGMLLLAVINGCLEVSDPLCGMGIGLGLLSRLGVVIQNSKWGKCDFDPA